MAGVPLSSSQPTAESWSASEHIHGLHAISERVGALNEALDRAFPDQATVAGVGSRRTAEVPLPEPTIVPEMTWQEVEPGEWLFGEMVRGIVRRPVARIYRNDILESWRWLAFFPDKVETSPRLYDTLPEAVDAAEDTLRGRGLL